MFIIKRGARDRSPCYEVTSFFRTPRLRLGGSLFLIGSQAICSIVGACAVGAALNFKFEQKLFCAKRRRNEKRGEAISQCSSTATKTQRRQEAHCVLFVYT